MAKADRLKREQLRQFEARQVLNAESKRRRNRDQWVWTGGAIVAIVASSLGLWAYDAVGPGAPKVVPDQAISEFREWSGELVIGDESLAITLDGQAAPQAVANFVALSQDGFYDGTSCHRLTTEGIFVLQCGDPLGNGLGNPGYTFGPIENAPSDNLYPAGTIAMARPGNNAEGMGSQFFIVYRDSTIPADSAGGYTVFGRVTNPLDSFIDAFVSPGTVDQGPDGAPLAPASILRITIR